MMLFLDTSALVKLYLKEPGSDAVQAQVAEHNVALAHLAYAEAYAEL